MPTRHPVSLVLVAIGGYGFHYVRYLWERLDPAAYRLAGVADPEADRSPVFAQLSSQSVPVFGDLEAFYASGRTADLAVIASPIHWHVPHAITALANGSHVLCEKPIGATVQEVASLLAARDAAQRWVMIGYQWSFSAAIQSLRRAIATGRYGTPLRLRAICCWPRRAEYYRRNGWAGRRSDPVTGRWVLDSPANNAMAHSLHNLFYLIGGGSDARPVTIEAETARLFPIGAYDTVACRARLHGGAELLFYASHATAAAIEPRFRLDCEQATIRFREPDPTIIVTDSAGKVTHYGAPDDTPQFWKLDTALRAVRDPSAVICPVEEARWQTLAVNGIEESVASTSTFPDTRCRQDATGHRYVHRLDADLAECYESARLPAEHGGDWGSPGGLVDLADYCHYPGGVPPDERAR